MAGFLCKYGKVFGSYVLFSFFIVLINGPGIPFSYNVFLASLSKIFLIDELECTLFKFYKLFYIMNTLYYLNISSATCLAILSSIGVYLSVTVDFSHSYFPSYFFLN